MKTKTQNINAAAEALRIRKAVVRVHIKLARLIKNQTEFDAEREEAANVERLLLKRRRQLAA